MKFRFSLLPLYALAVLVFIASCKKHTDDIVTPPPPPPPVAGDNDHILLGNPTNAIADPAYPENYFKINSYYKLAYSRSRGIPVWVSWHLQYEDRGSTPRQDDFRADTDLPSGWYQVQNNSYSGSGFDRGHNCPSADRTSTIAANSSTFLMTNMIPQAPLLNQGPWANLEDFIRNTLLGQTYEAYIVMGNYGDGGYNAAGLLHTINGGHVTVPSHVYKVVLILPKGNSDLSRINRNTTILAVDMPNNNTLYSTSSSGQTAWRNYITTVADLETSAHTAGVPLDLFTNIADSVRGLLKLKRYP